MRLTRGPWRSTSWAGAGVPASSYSAAPSLILLTSPDLPRAVRQRIPDAPGAGGQGPAVHPLGQGQQGRTGLAVGGPLHHCLLALNGSAQALIKGHGTNVVQAHIQKPVTDLGQIGRASCRERVKLSEVAGEATREKKDREDEDT